MIIDPGGKAMGMDAMLPFFQKLPFADVLFRDFLFSGFALLIVNGQTNLTAAGLLFRNKKAGVILGDLQKFLVGACRVWIDDNGWSLSVVEFKSFSLTSFKNQSPLSMKMALF